MTPIHRLTVALLLGLAAILAACGGATTPSAPASSAAPNARANDATSNSATSSPAPSAPATESSPPSLVGRGAGGVGQPERDRIQVAVGSLSANSTPLWLAMERGLFQKHGLTVETIRTESTAVATSLLAGESQIGLSSGVTAIQPVAAGARLKLLAYFDKTNPYSVVVQPYVATVADLRGKTIALARPGDTAEIAARIALQPHGIVLHQDLTPLQIGNSPNRYAALLSGQVDAAILSESFVDEAVAQGMRVLINLRQERLPFVNFGVIVSEEFAQTAPSTILAFLRGMLDGLELYVDRANRSEAMALIAQNMKLDLSDPLVTSEYEASYENLARDPFPDREGAEAILAALRGSDPARYGALTAEAVIDPSFMTTLRAAGAARAGGRP